MKTLDCESIESTYQSLEAILGIKEIELKGIFGSVDVYTACEQDRKSFTRPTDFLLSYVQKQKSCKTHFDATCWFHCTRTRPDNKYEEGILPLDQTIPHIMDFLFELCRDELTIVQSQFKTTLMNALRLVDTYDARCHGNGGPHALLIREAAIEAAKDSTYWNYFRIPEIVDDICKCCPYGVNLKHKYITNTAPCIVKFIDYRADMYVLRRALIYAYLKYRNLKLLPNSNLCFSAEGIPVPKDRILNVEFLRESEVETV